MARHADRVRGGRHIYLQSRCYNENALTALSVMDRVKNYLNIKINWLIFQIIFNHDCMVNIPLMVNMLG